jgi:hypothetical protein
LFCSIGHSRTCLVAGCIGQKASSSWCLDENACAGENISVEDLAPSFKERQC